MSQSEDNMNKQVRRHKGPLIGFLAIGLFIAALTVWFIGSTIEEADAPEGAPVQIDGRTGEADDADTDDGAAPLIEPETQTTAPDVVPGEPAPVDPTAPDAAPDPASNPADTTAPSVPDQ